MVECDRFFMQCKLCLLFYFLKLDHITVVSLFNCFLAYIILLQTLMNFRTDICRFFRPSSLSSFFHPLPFHDRLFTTFPRFHPFIPTFPSRIDFHELVEKLKNWRIDGIRSRAALMPWERSTSRPRRPQLCLLCLEKWLDKAYRYPE